jgi:beta-carotene hydroxylase
MRLRYMADVRALFWVFVLMPCALVTTYAVPGLAGWLLPVSMYLAYCAAVLAHNQNHCPVFVGRRANACYEVVLSVFYGYPTFAWIPTHNENHHKFVDRPGDVTITWRRSAHFRLRDLLGYFFVSSYHQAPLIREHMARLARTNPRRLWLVRLQYLAVFGGHAGLLALAVALHGAPRGAWVYASALGIPAFGALWGVMMTSYTQHVECDGASLWNHSRNFVSPWMNWFVFDNGFHTVHHRRPGLHWSLLRKEHEKIAAQIEPRLKQGTLFGYVLRASLTGRPRSCAA